MICSRLITSVRCVSSRTFCLQRSRTFGALRRFGSLLRLKLNPRNFRVSGRATALFASFTLSFSRRVRKRVTFLITPPLLGCGRKCCSHPHTVRSDACAVRVHGPVRRVRCSIEAEKVDHLAVFLLPPDSPARSPAHPLSRTLQSVGSLSCRSPAVRSPPSVCRDLPDQ